VTSIPKTMLEVPDDNLDRYTKDELQAKLDNAQGHEEREKIREALQKKLLVEG